jgi:hypothetical protein
MIGAYSMGVWKVIFCSRSGLFQQNAAAQVWAQEKRATMFSFSGQLPRGAEITLRRDLLLACSTHLAEAFG